MKLKKLAFISFVAVLGLSLVACKANQDKDNEGDRIQNQDSTQTNQEGQSAQIANPITQYENLAMAQEEVGFTAQLPENIPQEYTQMTVSSIDKSTLQLLYTTQDGKQEINFRQAKGDKDISGDYNSYDSTETIVVKDLEITVKSKEGKVFLATYQKDGFTFAIGFEDVGITLEDLKDIF